MNFIPLLVFSTGAASLIYEIVWMRMLIRVFGITLYATSTIISVYMGGLALGAWLFGRWSKSNSFSFRTLGGIELLIGLTSLLSTYAIRFLPSVYSALVTPVPFIQGSAPTAAFFRFLLSALVLVVPTLLMGCTLPLLTELLTERVSEMGRRLALLYGINTLGAVFGILFAGFISLGCWGEKNTVLIAAGVDFLAGFLFMTRFDNKTSLRKNNVLDGESAGRPFLFGVVALSGFCALALEVLWTRLLILILGTSVYAFSTMLSLYLLGIAVGSLLAARLVHKNKNVPLIFSVLQAALAFLSVGSLVLFHRMGLRLSDPHFLYSPINQLSDFPRLFLWGGLVIVPVTLLMGVQFPLLGQLVGEKEKGVGKSVGLLYAVNTLGGIAGSLTVVFIMIPLFGVQGAYVFICLIGLALAVASFLNWTGLQNRRGLYAVALIGLAACVLIPSKENIALSIVLNRLGRLYPGRPLFHHESVTASVTGYEIDRADSSEYRMLLINGIIVSGKGMAGSVMAHYPLLLHPHPQTGLVVCFGVGNTFRAALQHLERVDVVELVRDVILKNNYFYEDADRLLASPQARIFVNDGRNHLLTTPEKYDWIVVDASPPIFSEGTVNLYSLEFITLCRRRLNEGGIFCLWVPTPCFEENVGMIAQNFSRVFPQLQAWGHPKLPGVLMMGSTSLLNAPPKELLRRAKTSKNFDERMRLSMELVGQGWSLNDAEIRSWAGHFPPVTDDRPYSEFPLFNFLKKKKFWTTPDFLDRSKPGCAI